MYSTFIQYFNIFSVKILDREAIGISTIIKRLINECTSLDCDQLPSDLMKCFLEKTTLLTCQFSDEASNEENVC